MQMLLQGRTAVVFGGSGAIGTAVAHTLAREGARVRLGARTPDRLGRVARAIRAAGGDVETFTVDVLDEHATAARVARLAQDAGGIDTVVNATSFMHDQGKRLPDLSLSEFRRGFDPFLSGYFNIARAVAPHMGGDRPASIVTLVAPAAPMAIPGHLGHIVGCAGIEAFTRALACELGHRNIRVLCLRTHAIPEALASGSYIGRLFEPKAQAMGLSVAQWLGGAAQGTMLNRLPTLSQVAETVAFLGSDHAGAMTGTTVNMTAGATTG